MKWNAYPMLHLCLTNNEIKMFLVHFNGNLTWKEMWMKWKAMLEINFDRYFMLVSFLFPISPPFFFLHRFSRWPAWLTYGPSLSCWQPTCTTSWNCTLGKTAPREAAEKMSPSWPPRIPRRGALSSPSTSPRPSRRYTRKWARGV